MDILVSSWVRIVTGLSLVGAILLMGWLDNYYIFWAFFTFVFITSFHEATKLYGSANPHLTYYAILLWSMTLVFDNFEHLPILVLVIYGSLIAYKNIEKKDILLFIYPTIPVFYMFAIYDHYNLSGLFWLVAIVAGTDSGAYFVGRIMGKTPFSPVSPKKTLEGVIGGVILGTAIGTFFGVLGGTTVGKELGVLAGMDNIYKIVLISLVTAVVSIFGDLYESMLKREAGVKDSGNILPGHGGMLDRADGYLFGVIPMYILITVLY